MTLRDRLDELKEDLNLGLPHDFRERFELTEEEKALYQEFFLNTLPLHKLKLFKGGLGAIGSSRTIGKRIYIQENPKVPWPIYRKGDFFKRLLLHELVHFWEYHVRGAKYATGALWDQICSSIQTGDRKAAYQYELLPDGKEQHLMKYGPEQRAQLLQEYFPCWLQNTGRPGGEGRQLCLDRDKMTREQADAICERRRLELKSSLPR